MDGPLWSLTFLLSLHIFFAKATHDNENDLLFEVTFALGDMISLIFSNYLFSEPHSKNMTLHMSILIFVLIFYSIKHCSNLTKPNRWLELVMRYLIFFFCNIHNHHKIRFDT